MPLFAEALWTTLTAAGGSVALGLIVAIAVGINAMTLLFAGSAVVALERFARAAKRTSSLVLFIALWALVIAGFSIYGRSDELAGVYGMERLYAWGAAWLGSVALVGIGVLVTRLVLQRVPGSTLARATVVLLGLGTAFILGGTGRVIYAASPTAVALLGALWLLWGRRRGNGGVGEVERLLWMLALALAIGVALAVFLPTPQVQLAAAGGALLGVLGAFVGLGLVPVAAAGLLDTRLSAEWFIALRYLLAKRRQTFISVITGICVVGIAAGVWLIITVLSVMNGFERTWRDEIIGNRAHFTVHSGIGPIEDYTGLVESVANTPGVVAASPYVDAEGMVRGDHGEIMAVRVRGVDPNRIADVTDLEDDLIAGSIDALDASR
jgi:hypothetical protein